MDSQLHPVSVDAKDEHTETITNYQKFEEVFIKEEPPETTSQECEFYENVLQSVKKEDCLTDNDEQSDKEYENPITGNNDIQETENTNSKRFCCDICNKTFRLNCLLGRHKKVHSGIKEYQCDKCRKTFARRDNLRTHMETHSEIRKSRKYSCPTCNKSFTQSCNLNNHMITHSGLKDHKCTVCNKAFARKDNLKIHMDMHSGIKKFSCPICNKSFTQNANLISHVKIHSKVKD